MNPVAFSIGTLAVSWYGILTFIGTVFSFTFIYYRWRKNDYSKYHYWLMSTFTILFALFGARWWYLAFHPQDWTGMMDLFLVSSGRSIQGAIFFGGSFMFIYTTWVAPNLNFRKVASIVFPHILLGQAIGRWGNFTNQEVYGVQIAVEQLQWLPQFVIDGMLIDGVYRQPLFLYESMANFSGWIMVAFVSYNIKWFKPGTHAALYGIWYNTTRLAMELYRDPEFVMNINGSPTSFIMTAVFLFISITSFIVAQWHYGKLAAYGEFKLSNKIKLINMQYKLFFFKIMRQHTKENYKTLILVVKNRYNEYIESLDINEINEYKKEVMTWNK